MRAMHIQRETMEFKVFLELKRRRKISGLHVSDRELKKRAKAIVERQLPRKGL